MLRVYRFRKPSIAPLCVFDNRPVDLQNTFSQIPKATVNRFISKSKGILVNGLFLLALFFSYIQSAAACSCAPYEGTLQEAVQDAYKMASAVVLARAESVTDMQPVTTEISSGESNQFQALGAEKQQTLFVSLHWWKGVYREKFQTEIQTACCLCGYEFEQGETYLLFLYGPDDTGYFSTSTCSRTKPVNEDTTEEINILNSIGEGQ